MADDLEIDLGIEPGNTLSYLDELRAQLDKVTKSIETSEAWDEAASRLSNMDDEAEDAAESVEEIGYALQSLSNLDIDIDQKLEDAADATEAFQDEMRELLESTEDEAENVGYALQQIEDSVPRPEVFAGVRDGLFEIEDAAESATQAIEDEGDAAITVSNELAQYAGAVEDAVSTTDEFAEEVEEAGHEMDRTGEKSKSLASKIASMFVIDITRIPKLMKQIGQKLFGGSEEWDELQVQLDGMLHTMGAALLPILEGVGQGFEVVAGAVKRLSPIIRTIASGFATVASGIVESVAGMIVPIMETFAELATEVAARVQVAWTFISEQGQLLWTGISGVFNHIAELFGHTEGILQALQDGFTTAWNTISEGTAVAFAFVQTVIENWQLAASAAIVKFAHNAVFAFEEVKYFFTEVFPAALGWFGENWVKVFQDAGNFLGTALENMGTNIKEFFTQVMSWLKGDGFNFQFTGLLEGFEATVSAFPELTERQRSTLEQTLATMDEELSNQFGNKLEDQIAENQAALDTARSNIRASFDANAMGPELTMPEIEVETPEKSGEDTKDPANKTPTGELKTGKDVEQDSSGSRGPTGLADMANQIQAALFNRTDPTAEAVKEGTQKSVTVLEKIKSGTDDTRKAIENLDTRARYA